MTVEKIAELNGHGNPVFTLELSQKPGVLFTGGNDKGLVEWSLKNNSFIKVMFPVRASIYAIHCPAGYPLLFAGLRSGEVLVFDFIQQKVIKSIQRHIKPIFDIKSVIKKDELLIASEDGTICLYHTRDWALLVTLRGHKERVNSVAVHPSSKVALSVGRDRTIRMWDLMRGKGSASVKIGKGELSCCP